MLKTSAPELMQQAKLRAHREDVGATATWHYPGQGPTIVLVHGFRGDHHGLSAIAAALSDFHVVIPDLPGYGKTPQLDGKHDLDGYAQWLKEFLAELGEEPILVGHSFGSLLVAAAHQRGIRTKATILLNPVTTKANGTLPGKLAGIFYQIGKLGKPGSYLLRSAAVVRGMSIAMATTRNLQLRSFIHNQHLSFFSNYASDRVAQEGFAAANSSSVLDFARTLPKQLLVIAGEKDLIAPLPGQLKLQQATSAKLETLPVGHLTHYEAPFEVAELIRKHFGAK